MHITILYIAAYLCQEYSMVFHIRKSSHTLQSPHINTMYASKQ
jgi:hypothetical protein